ncbi:hypothetical protein PHMEG_00035533 [Phytophthora megakarya]|uniref:Uncharacterized protein n=1 Tax=Phytophthora megakarya TaxID=4795 RepID=A0A225UP02_9STRA|nr:hypothetical protein PHMEG_00035533 [Phytophthora megakarya]
MDQLRNQAINAILEFADEVLLDLEKETMRTMRAIVHSFRSVAVYFGGLQKSIIVLPKF